MGCHAFPCQLANQVSGLYRHPWDDITYLMPSLAKGAGPPGNEGRVEVAL